MRMMEEDKQEATKVDGLRRIAASLIDELQRVRARRDPAWSPEGLRSKEIDEAFSTLIAVYQAGYRDALTSVGKMLLRETGKGVSP